ncbi:MAG: 3-isopropylmalate dehydratase large subunit [Betaproteobacteria bacterium]|nr:3-isopropylmalate dehydratase large subunit [Betaproteobacteria bacterium]
MTARTLFEKIWADHVIVVSPQGEELLYVDFNLINEGQSFLAFDQLRMEGRSSRRPQQHLAVTDHYLPTINRDRGTAGMANPEIRRVVEMLDENATEFKLPHIGWGHLDQGIAHVIAPELGIAQPGMLITCNDSHTATNGACGVLAIPIGGGNQLRHVVATQTVWLKKPKTMRFTVDGVRPEAVTAKDVILSIIREIGVGGATGYAIEYAGAAIRAMSMESRLTICNMSIEGGARIGMVGPDDTTYQFLNGRRKAPQGADWDRALTYWKTLPTDADAAFDRELSFDAARFAPMVTWGTSPEDCSPVDGVVPDPSSIGDGDRRRHVERALDYMKLKPATPLQQVAIDRVFIGSCTNSRIEDLRVAAAVVKGRRVARNVKLALVVPGSGLVKEQAEREGLDRIFRDAGFEWREPGCSMCLGMNPDRLSAGERCASTSNRNFEGRQGPGGRTHLVSPAMAAAAAIEGHFVDIRRWT